MLQHWDTKPHVIAATGDDDAVDWAVDIAADPPWRQILIAEVDGRAVGVVQVIDPLLEDSHYWGDVAAGLRAVDIWIGEESDLGRGLGTQMMAIALSLCFAEATVGAVLIDPLATNVRARRFYERLGFVPVGLRDFGTDHCMVYSLDRATWASAHG